MCSGLSDKNNMCFADQATNYSMIWGFHGVIYKDKSILGYDS